MKNANYDRLGAVTCKYENVYLLIVMAGVSGVCVQLFYYHCVPDQRLDKIFVAWKTEDSSENFTQVF